jgi:hypothetical protein
LWHPSWEPFWQAVDEVRLPLHFHTFPTTPPRARQEAPQVRRAAMFTGVSVFQMGLIHIIAGMMGAGVFEPYPNLRVSFGESGAGWLAYALHRAGAPASGKVAPIPDLPTLAPERGSSLRVFGCLPCAGASECTEAGVRKASKEETAEGVWAGGGVGLWGFNARFRVGFFALGLGCRASDWREGDLPGLGAAGWVLWR